jgi:phospholipid/cholesterol/gamma-HCH transport system substrate-binding protein
MRDNTKYRFNLRKDSVILLSTAGVLGETYVDIDSSAAKGPEANDGDTLLAHDQPDFQDVVRASQGTLQNMDALLKRLDNIVGFIESGKGSIGKVIYSPALYDQLNATVLEFKGLLDQIQSGKGSLGPLVTSDESYKKALAAIDKINALVDGLQQGKGTAGKLLNDSQLYDNANKTMADVSQLTADINAGKGALGKIARDQEFAARLQTLMTNLSQLSDRLEKGQGTAGMLFNDPTLYNNSNQMLVETRELVKAIRENPKKYLTIHMKIF